MAGRPVFRSVVRQLPMSAVHEQSPVQHLRQTRQRLLTETLQMSLGLNRGLLPVFAGFRPSGNETLLPSKRCPSERGGGLWHFINQAHNWKILIRHWRPVQLAAPLTYRIHRRLLEGDGFRLQRKQKPLRFQAKETCLL